MIKYILNLFTSDRLADSDDRNAVIECSSRAFAFDKTKSGYQKVCDERVGGVFSYLLPEDSAKYSGIALNSLGDLIKSRLGVIRFLASGEMGDLDRIQIMQLFDEIDNQVEELEYEIDQHTQRAYRTSKQIRQSNNVQQRAVYDDYEIIKKSD